MYSKLADMDNRDLHNYWHLVPWQADDRSEIKVRDFNTGKNFAWHMRHSISILFGDEMAFACSYHWNVPWGPWSW